MTTDWMYRAACRDEGTLLFFGTEYERGPTKDSREQEAKEVCSGCTVRTDCLNYAIARPERYGTWGGLNEDERAAERRRRMRRVA